MARRVRRLVAGVGTAALLFAAGPLAVGAAGDDVLPAPTADHSIDAAGNVHGGSAVPGEQDYVVAVADTTALSDITADLQTEGVAVTNSWDGAATGLVAPIDDATAAALRARPDVIAVEPDRALELYATQSSAPWHLDRIDQAARPLDGSYSYATTGHGVRAYVIDSGLRTTHLQFAGRVAPGWFWDFGDGRGIEDCNGHGTHVAGILGGATWGVAKGVTIIPVKVTDCAGNVPTSVLVEAINWVIADHVAGIPAVANLSLGGAASAVVDDAVNRLLADGVTVVVAAGNRREDACRYSPARVPAVITVAASTQTDTYAEFSNYGPCNDVFAPGVTVTSAGLGSDGATSVMSGTSMAAPGVAGAAAMLLQSSPGASPAQIWGAIDARATRGVMSACCGDPDRLLRVGAPPPPQPPPPAGGDGPGATSRAPGQIDVFARGADDGLWMRTYNGSAWSGWGTLGGIIVGAPAATSRQGGVADVFVRGADDALWARGSNGTAWSGWYSLGGILTAAPAAVSRAAGTLDLFVVGADRALWTRSFNGASWGPWWSLGGIVTAAPAVASAAPGTLAVFVRGADNALWTRSFDGARWSGWSTLGGVIETAPGAASRAIGSYEVYARGSDGALWTRRSSGGGWTAWWSLGGIVTSPTAAVSRSPGVIDVFTRGADAALWANRDPGTGFSGWYTLGGVIR